jgi:hypothetical protein
LRDSAESGYVTAVFWYAENRKLGQANWAPVLQSFSLALPRRAVRVGLVAVVWGGRWGWPRGVARGHPSWQSFSRASPPSPYWIDRLVHVMADLDNAIRACSRCRKRFFERDYHVTRLGVALKTCNDCRARKVAESARHRARVPGCAHGLANNGDNCRDCGGRYTCEHTANKAACAVCNPIPLNAVSTTFIRRHRAMALAPWDDSVIHCNHNCLWYPPELERIRRVAAAGGITPPELARCEERWVLLSSVWAVLDAARALDPRQGHTGAFAIDARTGAVDWAGAEGRNEHCDALAKRMAEDAVALWGAN